MINKVCVVGAGRWGKNHVRTLVKLGCLGGIVETDKHSRKALQTEFPGVPVFQSLTQKGALAYDAYTVAVPAEFHFQVALTLLQNHKHVLVEKPITLNSLDADKLNTLAEQGGCVLMTGHLLLFHPAYQKMKEILESGKLGKLEYLYSNRLNLGTVRKEENILWSFAPHDISLFQYFVGQEPCKIVSTGAAFLQPHIHDTTMTSIYYPENVVGHIFVSWLHPFKEHRVVLIGSQGMVSFEDSSKDKQILYYEKGIKWINGEPITHEGPTEVVTYERAQALENELKHFIACVNGCETNDLISGRKGFDVLRILEMAEQSLKEEKQIVPPDLGEPGEKLFFVHPTAVVDDNVDIGAGTKIWHFSHIQPNVSIGKKCIFGQNVNIANNVKIGNFVKVQNNVSLYEGVELEDYVFCGPSMVFTNILVPRSKYPQAHSKYYKKTLVREGASIGANATIVCGNTIGRFAFVGAGAVVTKNVPDFAIVVGNPARIAGWISEAGTKLVFGKDGRAYCKKCKKWYLKKGEIVKEET
ncbi:Gfo/Idh/MocA family oxidoreductase [Thermoproteota archaeon]